MLSKDGSFWGFHLDKQLHPPKPALAFRVGVTGHRHGRLDPVHIERIERQIESVLDVVRDGLDKVAAKYAREYSNEPPRTFFVSALADGADTVAARCALKSDWLLLSPLPFQYANYASDFSQEDREELQNLLKKSYAIAELDGVRNGQVLEDAAYLQAGIVTIDQSDFLIAIWDGEQARGLGGTAMIKEEALNAGKTVVWINAVADREPVFLRADNSELPFSSETVLKSIDKIVAPPEFDEVEHGFSNKNTHALHAYYDYMAETAHRFNYGSFFQFWEKLFAGKWPFTVKLFSAKPDELIERDRQATLADKIDAGENDKRVFHDLIIPRFAWADHLAIHYGNLYRSSYFFNYIFAALAVFLALFDLVGSMYGIGSKTLWIGLEVTIIVAILIVTTAGKRGRWHEKWIDYRQLAEELRQYRLYFLTLGREANESDIGQGEGGEAAGWADWYFAATRREAGMSSSAFGADEIRSIARTILDEEIKPQIDYHNRKAGVLHSLEHRLHHLGEYAFGMTLLVCMAYLSLAFLAGDFGGKKKIDVETTEITSISDVAPAKVDACAAKPPKSGDGYKADTKSLKYWAKSTKCDVKGLVTMLTGFLPALGAAFFGIRVQGEFGSTAERSHATAAQLQTIVDKFEKLAADDMPRLKTLRIRVEEAARAMLMENMDWRLLYISKPLNLPG